MGSSYEDLIPFYMYKSFELFSREPQSCAIFYTDGKLIGKKKSLGLKSVLCALFPQRLGCSDGSFTLRMSGRKTSTACFVGLWILFRGMGKGKSTGTCFLRCYVMRYSLFFELGVNIGYMNYQISLRCLVNSTSLDFTPAVIYSSMASPSKKSLLDLEGVKSVCVRVLEAGVSEHLYIKISNYPDMHKVWENFVA